MHVRIHQPRQQGGIGQLDNLGVRRRRHTGPVHRDDATVLDQHHHPPTRHRDPIEQSLRLQREQPHPSTALLDALSVVTDLAAYSPRRFLVTTASGALPVGYEPPSALRQRGRSQARVGRGRRHPGRSSLRGRRRMR
jgi:hypothetical protein